MSWLLSVAFWADISRLTKLKENTIGAYVKVEPSLSRSFSVMKGAVADLTFFTGGEPMARVS